MLQRLFVFGILVFTGLGAYADDLSIDKSQYNLFNPTPEKAMREWRTDQAGVSPYTIDAGHFEAEITAVQYSSWERSFESASFYPGVSFFDHYTDKEHAWTYGKMTLKAGLLNCLDAEVSLAPYNTKTYSENGRYVVSAPGFSTTQPYSYRSTVSGFGDVSSKLKLNLWGNDDGATALSLSGNVIYPTGEPGFTRDQFMGGPGLEFAAHLPYDFEMRINSSVNFYSRDSLGSVVSARLVSTREASFENLISLGHLIVGPLYGYCLFDTMVWTEEGADWQAQIVPGLNYRLNKYLDLFVRSGFGVHGDAWDYSPSTGLNIRL